MASRALSAQLWPFAVVSIALSVIIEAVFQTIIAFVPREEIYWPATLLSLVTIVAAVLWHWHSVGVRPSVSDRLVFASAAALGSVMLVACVGLVWIVAEGLPVTSYSFLLLAGIEGELLEDASNPVGMLLLTLFYFTWEFVLASFGAWVTVRSLSYC